MIVCEISWARDGEANDASGSPSRLAASRAALSPCAVMWVDALGIAR
jgi:hypothetical protein